MSPRKLELEPLGRGLRRWSEADVERALGELQRRRRAEARLAEALPEVSRGLRRWDSEQVEEQLRDLDFRMNQRRSVSTWVVVSGAVLAAAAIALVSWRGAETSRATTARLAAVGKAAASTAGAGAASRMRRLALSDGSEVNLPDSTSQARVTEERAEQVVVTLEAGRAEFRVKHRAERRFVVQIGGVQIEDLGTVFEVERGALEVSIRVREGRVRVVWQDQRVELGAGEQGRYPLEQSSGTTEKAEAAEKPASAATTPPKPAAAEIAWRAAAQAGRYKEAFQLLERESFATVPGEPSDLLLAADVARFSGHPEKAVQPLRNLLRLHGGDPRCPAAAFTLGSILLRNLGRPGEAAGAFDESLRLAPAGNLSEDAAAHAAEAWFKAGQRGRAQAALERYQTLHPSGRHLAFLKGLIQSRD